MLYLCGQNNRSQIKHNKYVFAQPSGGQSIGDIKQELRLTSYLIQQHDLQLVRSTYEVL